jgi:hypothetical protein
MSRKTLAIVLSVVLMAPAVALAAGAKKPLEPSNAPTDPPPQKTPGEMAVDHFNFGLAYRDKAWKLEEKAAGASNEKERMKLDGKAQKTWVKAIREFEYAVDKNPAYYQAFGSLGYALRRTGLPRSRPHR